MIHNSQEAHEAYAALSYGLYYLSPVYWGKLEYSLSLWILVLVLIVSSASQA